MKFGYFSLAFLINFTIGSVLSYADEVRVAAASSLTFALEEIHQAFSQQTDHQLKISYAASGTLTRQIEHGAPFDIFLSADSEHVKILVDRQLVSDAGQSYAAGELVLFWGTSPTSDLNSLIVHQQRLSIANPNIAPYGRLAKNHLQQIELWDAAQDLLILGESAAQSARFALSGAVSAALLPRSLAQELVEQNKGEMVLLAQRASAQLEHRMVLLHPHDSRSDAAQTFFQFMLGEAAQAILAKAGFTPIESITPTRNETKADQKNQPEVGD